MTARRAVAIVLIAGVGIGGTAALIDRSEPQRALAAPVAGDASRTAAQRVPILPIGPVAIVARADDPGRAAPWAIRRLVTRARGNDAYPCLQLGRLDGARFGWIAPGRPLRLARFDQADVPTICGEHFLGGLPQLSTITLTTDAAAGLPRPDRTIVWGALPPGIASARLSDGTELRAGAHGTVLAVLPGRPVGEPHVAGTLRTRGGASRPFSFPGFDRYTGLPPSREDERVHRRLREAGSPITSRIEIAARVPDPAGGAAWGILTAPSTRGGTCFSVPGRVVGKRLAAIEPRLGVARPAPFGQQLDCVQRRAPTAAQPLRMDVLLSSISDEDPTGTTQLRRLNDRTVLHGRTTADVTAVTITTSRDIRTVVPDPRTGVVIAVYDGAFPDERLKVTATLRDGRQRTVLQASGG
ncbi:MAG: hypothetical protein Q8O56_02855 [Solirubrobacteraceae bacterium]|nr:hypothetical protein [Solirubrobacteraceae bacterium]